MPVTFSRTKDKIMQTAQAIKHRRAVKSFDAKHVMTEAEKQKLLELAQLSPTSFNIQNWRFVVVEDQDLKNQLRAVAWDQSQVSDCSMLVILCADVKSWAKDPERYWASATDQAKDFLLPAIENFYKGREWMQRDEAMRSVGIAAQTLMLAAVEMGYDSCPMIGFDGDKVAKMINLPDDHVIGMFVAIGKKAQEPKPRPDLLPLEQVVIKNRF